MAQANISSFIDEPDKLEKLLRLWDKAHQKLYADKRKAVKEQKRGHAEVVPQWPLEGSLRRWYLSVLRQVNTWLINQGHKS